MYTMHHGDAIQWANQYQGPLYQAMYCDPPYHLTSISERFGKADSKPAKHGTDGAFARASKGFMGKDWDGGDLAFQPETWAAFYDLLCPGAFCMAFAGSRGWHRMAVAIEDAGFIIHPTLFGWGYGSGFPKATRVKGASDFAGHRYGGQALKPALEPIIVFQVPYAGKPVECITTTGAGALNIDAARIGNEAIKQHGRNGDSFGFTSPEEQGRSWIGRWPSNLLLSHSPLCAGICVPDCPIERLGQQSGERPNGYRVNPSTNKTTWFGATDGSYIEGERGYTDLGTAARYFHQSDYMLERLEHADAVAYYAKASSAEREAGLDPLQVQLIRDWYGLENDATLDETTINDGRKKSIDNPYQRGETERRNIHPTIKPLSLNRHLCSLLLPPDAYAPRRLLIPFGGVASELIGAMLAGWEHIDAVELDAQHVTIAQARIAYWQQQRHKFNQGQPIKVKTSKGSSDQLLLF
jgi:hypothetical protein